jgi:hypothetical protein
MKGGMSKGSAAQFSSFKDYNYEDEDDSIDASLYANTGEEPV